MKLIRNAMILYIVLSFCFSCGGIKEKVFTPIPADVKLFQSAEEKYQNNSYREAYASFEEHSRKFPNSSLAPQVLLRMGQIQLEFTNYSKAQDPFQRVIELYPSSPFAKDAGIEMMRAHYFLGKYQEAISDAEKESTSDLSDEQSFRLHMIVGDSYLALRSPLKAYHEFMNAYEKVMPKDNGQVVSRLKTSISLLPSSDIRHELKQVGDQPPGGYLMFQLGKNLLAEGKTEVALSTFASFIEKFPDHEDIAQARDIMDKIKSPQPIEQKTIGCLLPLSGRYEAFGQKALKGIELALTLFARDQGGASIKIQIKDTGSEPARAEQSVRELKESNAFAIIGPVAASEEAAVKAQELKIPIITLTQKSNITDVGDYVFRNFLTPEMQVKTLVEYAIGTLNVNRFAIFYPDESYGNAFMKAFKAEVIRSGGTISSAEIYNPNETDFEAPIKKLIGYSNWTSQSSSIHQDSQINTDSSDESSDMDHEAHRGKKGELISNVNFEAVFMPDSPDKVGLIIPLFAYYGVRNIYLLGTNLWHSEKMIEVTDAQIQGAVIPEGFFEQSGSENVAQFVSEFEKSYSYTPGFIEAVSYDTAMILFDLAVQPDVKSAADMKQKLLAMPSFQGVTGVTTFSPNGEAVKDIYLLKIIGGKFREIYYK